MVRLIYNDYSGIYSKLINLQLNKQHRGFLKLEKYLDYKIQSVREINLHNIAFFCRLRNFLMIFFVKSCADESKDYLHFTLRMIL